MEWQLVLILLIGSLIVLLGTGIPVAFAFIVINVIFVFFFWGGGTGLERFTHTLWDGLARFTLMPVTMFVLLGEVLFRTGMAFRAIDVVDKWLGRVPGRLGLVTVAAATLLSALSGVSSATAATLGDTLLPEMEKRGYKRSISIGSIIGSGGLAMLIPPSGLAVLWAAIAEVSVGKILIAGIIPGLLIAAFYALYVVGRCWLQPSIAPPYSPTPTPTSMKLYNTAKYVLPLGLIILMVTGFIFLGISTPSESAALGVLGSLILAAAYRQLNWEMLKSALVRTVRISVMILIIIASSKAFSQVLAFTGATQGMVDWVMGMNLPGISLIIVMLFTVLFLGMFMNALPIMLITIPIYLPIVEVLGYPTIWFGLLFLVCIEMSLTTPPYGSILFVMKGVAPAGTTFGEIVRAGIPFLMCDAMAVALIIAFPQIALWLPNLAL
ncbi:MAG: TRAP transporter large permease subunit [Chloroflexota bacterium]